MNKVGSNIIDLDKFNAATATFINLMYGVSEVNTKSASVKPVAASSNVTTKSASVKPVVALSKPTKK